MVPFFIRLLERDNRLPTLTQRGRGGLGASTFFSQTPEPNLALISRKLFGSNVDRREIGARFYAMSTDPQPIRTGLRGIIVDPNKKGSRREVSALRLTHNEKKTVQHCAECKVIVCNAMERRPFCDSGSVRGESVAAQCGSSSNWLRFDMSVVSSLLDSLLIITNATKPCSDWLWINTHAVKSRFDFFSINATPENAPREQC